MCLNEQALKGNRAPQLSGIRASRIWFGPTNQVGPKKGCYTLEVSEPRFRQFYKMILKLSVNDFENFYDIHCICT